MLRKFKVAAGAVILTLALTHCGKNPLGAGAPGGLNFFAKIGKAMSRPSAVNDEENGQVTSKDMVQSGVASAKQLAKGFAGESQQAFIRHRDIYQVGDTLVYYEDVVDKPSEENPYKWVTGRGEVRFKYNGLFTTLRELNSALIADIYSWRFIGRETRIHRGIIDSVQAKVEFISGGILDTNNIKPGKTTFWAENISATIAEGQGDTAAFILDSLDDPSHTQYGHGSFLDAHSGRNDTEGPKAFDFDLTIIHKNDYGTNPYLHYECNEGIMNFKYPWGNTGDSLYFEIHFYPNRFRKGHVFKNNRHGAKLIYFENNEDNGVEDGTTIYYDEKTGDPISTN